MASILRRAPWWLPSQIMFCPPLHKDADLSCAPKQRTEDNGRLGGTSSVWIGSAGETLHGEQRTWRMRHALPEGAVIQAIRWTWTQRDGKGATPSSRLGQHPLRRNCAFYSKSVSGACALLLWRPTGAEPRAEDWNSCLERAAAARVQGGLAQPPPDAPCILYWRRARHADRATSLVAPRIADVLRAAVDFARPLIDLSNLGSFERSRQQVELIGAAERRAIAQYVTAPDEALERLRQHLEAPRLACGACGDPIKVTESTGRYLLRMATSRGTVVLHTSRDGEMPDRLAAWGTAPMELPCGALCLACLRVANDSLEMLRVWQGDARSLVVDRWLPLADPRLAKAGSPKFACRFASWAEFAALLHSAMYPTEQIASLTPPIEVPPYHLIETGTNAVEAALAAVKKRDQPDDRAPLVEVSEDDLHCNLFMPPVAEWEPSAVDFLGIVAQFCGLPPILRIAKPTHAARSPP